MSLNLCEYPRSGYGPVDFIDPWFLISGFIVGPINTPMIPAATSGKYSVPKPVASFAALFKYLNY